MGTNYYLLTRRLEGNEWPEEGLHIGKRSCGWVFQFQAHPSIKSLKGMIEATKEGYIYNEYGEEIPYDEFWELVRETKEPYEDGSVPIGITEQGKRFGDYESEGYPFSTLKFS